MFDCSVDFGEYTSAKRGEGKRTFPNRVSATLTLLDVYKKKKNEQYIYIVRILIKLKKLIGRLC